METSLDGQKCKYCGSTNVIKYGLFKTTQLWWCKDCQRKFTGNGAKPNMKTDNDYVSIALGMYYEGISLNAICKYLDNTYGIYPSDSTIHEWVVKYTTEVDFVTSELHPKTDRVWWVGGTELRIMNTPCFVWDVMDIKSRYLLTSIHTYFKSTDGLLRSLDNAVKKSSMMPLRVLFSNSLPESGIIELLKNLQLQPFTQLNLNDFSETEIIRDFCEAASHRNKVLQSLKHITSLEFSLKGWQLHYNYLRYLPNRPGVTPSELAETVTYLDSQWYATIKHARWIINEWLVRAKSVETTV